MAEAVRGAKKGDIVGALPPAPVCTSWIFDTKGQQQVMQTVTLPHPDQALHHPERREKTQGHPGRHTAPTSRAAGPVSPAWRRNTPRIRAPGAVGRRTGLVRSQRLCAGVPRHGQSPATRPDQRTFQHPRLAHSAARGSSQPGRHQQKPRSSAPTSSSSNPPLHRRVPGLAG